MIFIAGATGFVGRHLTRAFKEAGIQARCLVRNPKKAASLKALGFDTVTGDITDPESLKGALDGVHTALHLVGIIEEKHGATFEGVHVQGTRNLAGEAARAGVKRFFYQSALGADKNSWARYLKTKAEAEDIVRGSGLLHTIFRPSLITGPDDGFTLRIKGIISTWLSPIIPIPGAGKAKFQPIHISDWIRCFQKVMDEPEWTGKTYELGGPEHLTYTEIVKIMAKSMRSHKPVVHMPASLVKPTAVKLGLASEEMFGLLETDNVCDPESVKKLFGFEPLTYRESLRK